MINTQWPVFKYGILIIGLVTSLFMMVTNTAWAWGIDNKIFRASMVSISICADIGAVCFLFAASYWHSKKSPSIVMICVSLWVLSSAEEIAGSSYYIGLNMQGIDEPAIKAAEMASKASAMADMAAKDLLSERENLKNITKALLSEQDRDKIRDLRKQRTESEQKIESIKPKTFKTFFVETKNIFTGNEIFVSLAVWLVSQGSWIAISGFHVPRETNEIRVEPERSHRGARGGAMGPHRGAREPEEGPEGPKGGSKEPKWDHIEEPGAKMEPKREPEEPTNVVPMVPRSQDDGSKEPDKISIYAKILILHSEGLSIRGISKELNIGRKKVASIIAKSTKGRVLGIMSRRT